ncbi:MAG: hypothetical protein ACE5K9_04950 [Candidatus Methylomirabilales bacterium]
MEPVLSIRARVAALGWRIRWHRGVRWSTRCLHYSLLATLPFLLAKSFLPGPPGLWVLVIAITGAGGGLFYGLSRPIALSDLARLIEERLNLQARLSTALEYDDRQDDSPFALALYRDALRALPPFSSQEIVPLRFPRECWGLLPTAAAVLVLLVIPPLLWQGPGSIHPSSQVAQGENVSSDPEQMEAAEHAAIVKTPQPFSRRWRSDKTPSSGILQQKDVPFKDMPLSRGRSDFSNFLKGADERVRFLGRSQRIPDLKGEELHSPYQAVFEKMQELTGGRGAQHLTPNEVKELLSEVERLGKRGDSPGLGYAWTPQELSSLTPGRARETLEEALEGLREQEGAELRRSEVTQRSGRGSSGGEKPADGEKFDDGERAAQRKFGPLAGHMRSGRLRGEPTSRLDASPHETGLTGQQREGGSHMINTTILRRAEGGKPTVSEVEVLAQYRQMVEEALSRETIPPDYREQVKAYFDALALPRGKSVQ